MPAVRYEGIEARLQVQVRLGLEQIGDRVAELLQRAHDTDTFLSRAGVTGPDPHDRLAVHVGGQEREGLRHAQLEDGAELVGRGGGESTVEAQHLGGILEAVED